MTFQKHTNISFSEKWRGICAGPSLQKWYDVCLFAVCWNTLFLLVFMPPAPPLVPEVSCFRVVRPSVPLSRYRDISRTTSDMNFKLNDSMYHHRNTIRLDFGVSRSKVKGHRGQFMKVQVFFFFSSSSGYTASFNPEDSCPVLTISQEPLEI